MGELGLRYNEGKLRYDLVQAEAHEGMVKVLTFGSSKYAERNWEKGMKWSKVIASLKRHIAAIEKGEDFDPESGLLHADHLQCNAHFLSAYYKLAPALDDRPHSYLKQLRIGLDIDGVLGDFISHIGNKFGRSQEDIVTHWNDPKIRSWFEEVKKDSNFWATMPVLTSPKDIPFEPTCYVTSRSISSEITQDWLDRNGFPSAKLISLGHNQSKVQTLQELRVDIYVDDRIENFIELNKAGIFCYLFNAPHNKRLEVGHKRIHSLKELK